MTIDVSRQPVAPESQRILGLDAWRGVLLSMGIVLHATHFSVTPLFAFLGYVGSCFSSRMPAFFMISGFLSAVTLVRAGRPQAWLKKRLLLVSIPFLFGCVLLNSLMFAELAVAGPHDALLFGYADRARFLWYAHLWFLLVLFNYTLILFALWVTVPRARHLLSRTHQALARLLGVLRPVSFLALVLVVIVFAIASMRISGRLPLPPSARWIVSATITNLPYYLLGCAIGLERRVLASLTGPLWMLALIPAVGHIALRSGDLLHLMPYRPPALTDLLLSATTRAAVCLAIMRTALAMRRVPVLFQKIAQSSYTIYLFHVLALATLAVLLHQVIGDVYVIYTVAVVVTLFGLLLLDQLVIRRHPLLRLLINGRRQ